MRCLVVLPTYNERENIVPLLHALLQLHASPWTIDVLVVDDASPDGTADLVREIQRCCGDDRLKIVVRSGKGGRGSACLRGFREARRQGYDAVLEMDTDLSHDPADIPRFLAAIADADVVVGSKYVTGSRIAGWEWYRTVLSRGANLYARAVLRLPIRDYTNGYRCYGRRAIAIIPDLPIDGTGFTVIPQLSYQLHRAGMQFREIPITFTNRRHGTSNMSVREIVESFLAILRIRFPSLRDHPQRFTKFALVGFTGLAVDMLSLVLAVEVFHLHTTWGFALSSTLATINNFSWNVRWTFHDRGGRRHRQFLAYASLYAFDIVAATSLAATFTWMGLYYVLSKILTIPLITLWNYLTCAFVIFRTPRTVRNSPPLSSPPPSP